MNQLGKAVCLLLYLLPMVSYGQVVDDFSDGNFTSNPAWGGDISKFVINSDTTLQSNGDPSNADTLVLTIPSSAIDSTEWRFYMQLDFNPTATGNYVKVYLVSDNSDLEGSLNGYYLRIGETGSSDTLELFRQTGTTDSLILTGSTAFGSTTKVSIRVTRDNLGNWNLYADPAGGVNYNFEGLVNDVAHTTTNFFGLYCKYSTASRYDQYLFDDFYIGAMIGDTLPPTISSLNVTSDTTLDVVFSEYVNKSIAENTSNYLANNTIGNPVSALRDVIDSSIVHLTFTTAFGNGVLNTLTVNSIEDISGNAMVASATQGFLYFVSVAAAYKDVLINEILPDPSPPNSLPNAEFMELYNNSSKVFDLAGWELVNTTTSTFLSSHLFMPNSYIILCDEDDTALYSPYGSVVMGIVGFTALTNGGDSLTLLDNSGLISDIVSYEDSWYNDPIKDEGGWSLELINPNHPCSFANNWTASTNPGGGTPGFQNSVYSTLPDTMAPDLSSAYASSSTQITLTFSESMDSVGLATASYSIQPSISITSVQVSSLDFTMVNLILSSTLDTGIVYTITISNVSDCSGNLIGTKDTAQFLIPYPVELHDVLLNEILPDPSPPNSLPNAEFIELYNNSSKVFDLAGWELVNTTTSTFLSSHLFMPNSYIILCDEDDTALYSPYGSAVMGISGFTSLSNGGDSLTLLDNSGLISDIVSYEDSWYNDLLKDDGGWSLELINPNHPCSFANNWTVSTNPGGGTPGFKNSVYSILPDTIAPELSSAFASSATQVVLVFGESLDSMTLATALYTIVPTLSVTSVQVSSSDFTTVDLIVSPAMDTGTVYTVTVNNVLDCSGNVISGNNTAQFLIPYPMEIYDIVVNEIFADPSPAVGLPEFEYVEFYNRSAKTFYFDGGVLVFPGDHIIWCKEEAVSEFEQYGKTITSNFSSLSNGGGTVWFHSGNVIIHSITYSSSWYGDNSKDDGGWSLEMIDVNNPCEEENNWRASADPSGGTPGRQNSIFGSNPDDSPPKLLRADAPDTLHVLLTFNEVLDSADIASATYSVNKGVVIDSISVKSSKTVMLTFSASTTLAPSTVYTVTVTGLYDCVGNGIGTDNTAPFALPEQAMPGDLIINEILSNPTVDGSVFIEIYNNSDKYINLDGWKLANWDDDTIASMKPITNAVYVVSPEDYVALTVNKSKVAGEYPLGIEEAYFEMQSLPKYNNDDGTVILLTNLLEVSDSITYTEDMQFSLLNDADGVSLERLDFNRPTYDKTNWHSAAQDAGFATPGYKNSQSNPADSADGEVLVFPEIFSPDNDGIDDVVDINYSFPSAGFVGTILIYDSKGRLIRTVLQNELLGRSGTFSWDGTQENGEKGRVGIYIVYFEAFGLLGEIIQFKRPCVLAGKL